MKTPKLGDILVEMGAIDGMQLQAALAHHRKWGRPLGDAVVELRFCDQDRVMQALSRQTGLPAIDLDREALEPALAPLISRKVAEAHRVIPLRLEGARGETLVVAIAAPAHLVALDEIRSVSKKKRIRPFLATDHAISRAIGRLYGGYMQAETAKAEARNQARREGEAEITLEPALPTVLVYGWPEQASHTLIARLGAQKIQARRVGAMEVLDAGPHDVMLAPIPSMEVVLGQGQYRGLLIAAAKKPEDMRRAERLGAKAFILAPLDFDLVLRAIRRCVELLSGRPLEFAESA